MKIWCCLCFTEDEEEQEDSTKMKEGFTAIEDDSEGNIQNNEEVQMQLGLSLDIFSPESNNGPAALLPFDDMITAMGSNNNDDMSSARRLGRWLPVFRGPRRYDGESSSSASGSGLAIDDSQHKRAKVYSASS